MVCCCQFLPHGRAATACAQWVGEVGEALHCGSPLPLFPGIGMIPRRDFTRGSEATEDAALPRAVVKFRTGEMRRTAEPAIEPGREPHAENRRGKVNPTARPDAA